MTNSAGQVAPSIFRKDCGILVLLAAVVINGQGALAGNRPNIVLLLADDLGYGDLALTGHPTIRTPRLDQMASAGVRLTSYYSTAPACTPSRAALLTGRYPFRSGLSDVLGPDSSSGIPSDELTLAEGLKSTGYRTIAIGKWHLGHARGEYRPRANGFDSYFGLLYSNDMIRPWVQTDEPLQLWQDDQPLAVPVDSGSLTGQYTERALEFIRRSGSEPFFLYLAYSMPHVPIGASQSFRGGSPAGLYGDVIEEIDSSVGRILDELARCDFLENTLIVFTSDNGPWLNMPDRMFSGGVVKPWHGGSPGPFRGAKGTTYEGGVRVPCLVQWPERIPGNRSSAELVTSMDLYTTLLEAAGIRIPDDRPVDGLSVLSLLAGHGGSPRKEYFYFLGKRLEAVRDSRWKLRVTSTQSGAERPAASIELFDLMNDPSERYNLASEQLAMVQRLAARVLEFARGAHLQLDEVWEGVLQSP